MESREILALLPWRHPFLMLDRMIEFKPHERIVTLKNVSSNDPLACRSGPDGPCLPDVMLLEGMSQGAALLYRLTFEGRPDRLPLLGFLKASLHQPATFGSSVRFHVTALKMTTGGGVFAGEARSGDRLLAEAELGFAAASPGEV